MSTGIRSVNINRSRRTVEVEMDFDAAIFIGMELPPADGFTVDWWRRVWEPVELAKENP